VIHPSRTRSLTNLLQVHPFLRLGVVTLGLLLITGCGGKPNGSSAAPSFLNVGLFPIFTSQPSSQSVTAGQSAQMRVEATGNGTPTFLWQCSKDGVTWSDIPGSTSATYAFIAQLSDNGTRFRSVATNGLGTVASCAATLTVKDIAPSSLTYATSTATYSVGTNITENTPTCSGGTVTSYSVSPALPAGLSLNATTGSISGTPTEMTGSTGYSVTATNSGGGTTAIIRITIVAAPTTPVVTAPTYATVATLGHAASVTAQTGCTYAWTITNGTITAGATSNAITFTSGNSTGTLTLACTVTNAAGTFATSSAATTLVAAPAIDAFTASSILITSGDSITLNWTVTGATSLKFDGADVTGAVTQNVSPSTTSTYTLTAANAAGTEVSRMVTVTVVDAPVITGFSASPSLIATGGIATLTFAFTGGTAVIEPKVGTFTTGGTTSVSPSATTPYILTVTNGAGATASQSIAIATMESLNTARYGHSATLLKNGKVLFAGGAGTSFTAVASAELFDPATGRFIATGSMGTGRMSHTATLLPNGKVLIAGGENGNGINFDSAELYDPATEQFMTLGTTMIAERVGHTATLLPDGRVLIAGSATTDVGTAELFDPATGTFSATRDASGMTTVMTSGRYFHTATLLPDGKVLIAGGGLHHVTTMAWLTVLDTAELFDPATGTFSATKDTSGATASMTSVRLCHTATLLPDGKVLLAGGSQSFPSILPLSSAELYDPATGTFSATQDSSASTTNMTAARTAQTATLLPDGKVLIAGGYGPLPSTELYDPAAGTFAAAASLSLALDLRTATLLANGEVLIAGGFGSSGPLSSTEPFIPEDFASCPTVLHAPEVQVLCLNASVALAPLASTTASGATWSLFPATLPTALTFDTATGTIHGTPTTTCAPTRYTVTATLGKNTTSRGLWIAVVGPATQFVMTGATSVTAGSAQTFTITALDASGNSATDYAGTVTLASSDLQAIFPASVTLIGGIGSFSVTLATTGSQTITATYASLTATLNVTVVARPVIATFGAGSSTITSGSGTVLNWTVTGVTSLDLDGTDVLGLTTKNVSPVTTTTYTLTAANTIGVKVSKTVTVTVVDAPVIARFTASPTLIAAGGSSTLTFAFTGGTGTITDSFGAMVGTFSASGSTTVSPSAATSYTLTVNNTAGAHVNQSVTVVTLGNMNSARAFHTDTLLKNGQVLITGGYDGSGSLNSAELFDPAIGTFTTTTGNMTCQRFGHTATLLPDGKVLIAGGQNLGGYLASAELFNPATGTFTATSGNLTAPLFFHTATLLPDGKVLLVGGAGVAHTAELFDPATGTFTATSGTMANLRDAHTATLLPDGKVLLVGGMGSPLTAELFNPATGTFTATTGTVIAPRNFHTATLLPNGKVLIVGGDASPTTAELFDPATGTFTATSGNLNESRFWHNATLLPDGKVLLAAGYRTLTTERFDPAYGTFTPAASLSTSRDFAYAMPRCDYTATLLANGEVLIAGGYDGSTVLSSAEPFIPTDLATCSAVIHAPEVQVLSLNASATIAPLTSDTTTDATWGLSPATLPIGLTFDTATGAISGTPTATCLPTRYTVTATSDSISTSRGLWIAVHGLATHFTVTGSSTVTAGSASTYTVTALDASGNTATDYACTVSITSSDSSATLPASSTLTGGIGTFSVTLRTAGSRTITATDTASSSITGTNSAITVVPGEPATVSVSGSGSMVAGGASLYSAVALDACGNTVTADAHNFTFTITPDGVCNLGLATAFVAGVHTITATYAATTGTANVTVTAGSAASFTVTGYPSPTTAGVTNSFTVTALDVYRNVVTGYSGTVRFTSSDETAVFPANSTLTIGAGTFSATLGTLGIQTITVTDTVSSSITGTSSAIAVVAAPSTPTITAAASVHVSQTGCSASVGTQAGCTYAWTISNGTINSGLASNAIAFTAGTSGGTLTLSCIVSNAADTPTTASATASVTVIQGAFSATNSMNTARERHTATLLLSGKVLVTGGVSSSGYLAELYNPASRVFAATTNSMSVTHSGHTATLLPSGKVLIVGGGASPFASAELYDPTSGEFTPTGSLNAGRFWHTATLLPNGKVLIAGGDGSSYTCIASAELYDPATGTFIAMGSLNAARYGHTATLLPNGKVLIAGGYEGANGLASAELYDPATGTFTSTVSLNAARCNHTATFLPSGKVLIAGGYDGANAIASCEMYDPVMETFTTTGSLGTARRLHTATLLPSGKVLIAGGENSSSILASAELYDRDAGTFTLTGSLNTARTEHTAALLPSGKVLIVGGQSISIDPVTDHSTYVDLSSAELFDPEDPATVPTVLYAPEVAVFTLNDGSTTVTPLASDATTWSISPGLPTGLSLNAATGVISGTPTATGTAHYTVTASNPTNGTATASNLWLTVVSAAPTLTVNLAATSVPENAGAAATTVTITRNTETSAALAVSLSSSDKGLNA